MKTQKVQLILISAILLFSSCCNFFSDEEPISPDNINNGGGTQTPSTGSKTADHTVVNELRLGRIPEADILNAKNNLRIAYGHTSHGSQITTGMNGLVAFANGGGLGTAYAQNLFQYNSSGSGGALHYLEGDGYGDGVLDHDAGYYPAWVNETQAFLDDDAYNNYNVIMWSWCGQAAGKTEETMLSEYLQPMAAFEAAHPEVTFIYMTGHLDGSGEDGNLHRRNEQIRQWCRDNDCWLYDFADIESYDPDGKYFLDRGATDGCAYDGGNWATEWQGSHTVDVDWYDCGGAHTQSLNSNMKAYAAWWLFCRIAAE